MARSFNVEEKYLSPNGHYSSRRGSTHVIGHVVFNTATIKEATEKLLAETPDSVTDPLTGRALIRGSHQLERLTDNAWDAVVTYEDPDRSGGGGGGGGGAEYETEDIIVEVDTTGGSQHITQSLSPSHAAADGNSTKYDPPDPNPAEFAGAINVRSTGDGGRDVDGVDIVIGSLKFRITKFQPASFCTFDYFRMMARNTGKMNSQPWNGLESGEGLFMGGTAQQRNRGDWQVTYEIAFSETIYAPAGGSLPIGFTGGGGGASDSAGVITKKRGWDYLWVYYAPKEDEDAFILAPKPLWAYVERVYDEFDFADLAISEQLRQAPLSQLQARFRNRPAA